MTARILVIDDSAAMRDALAEGLRACIDADVLVAGSGAEGLALLDTERVDVVLLDVRMPDLDGAAVCERIVARDDPPAVVMVSAYDQADYGERAAAAGATAFVQKADGLAPILDAVERLAGP